MTTPMSSFSSTLLSSLFILLTNHPCNLYAQPQQTPTPTTSSTAVPSLVDDYANGDTVPSAFIPSSVSSAIPSATDTADYGNHDDTASSPHNGILNYYFLLLAAFVIAMLVVYWSLARRRRKAAAQLRRMRESVLSEDVRSWTRHQRAGLGFGDEERGRAGGVEGLDAAGEAPPAYVKEPDRVHLQRGEGVELREVAGLEGKPPDYEERLSSR